MARLSSGTILPRSATFGQQDQVAKKVVRDHQIESTWVFGGVESTSGVSLELGTTGLAPGLRGPSGTPSRRIQMGAYVIPSC